MGKIIVADESDVRKIVKDEVRDLFNNYLKNEFYKVFSKLMDVDGRLTKFENMIKWVAKLMTTHYCINIHIYSLLPTSI